MNVKKSYRLFLSVILAHIVVVLAISFLNLNVVAENIVINCILSEMIIWVPCVIYLAVTKTNPVSFCRMKKVRISTLFKTALFTFLCMPLVTLVNAVSMLFVDNAMLGMSDSILDISFLASVLLIGVYGPFCEELVFRGAIYNGLKKQGNGLLAVLMSALLFGLMHMNFNQAAYAFVIGIAMAFLVEATDSMWTAFLMHFLINTNSTVLLFLTELLPDKLYEETMEQAVSMGKMELLLAAAVYFVLAVLFTPLAACVLYWIAKGENRLENIKEIWYTRHTNRKSYVTVSLIAALIICLAFMVFSLVMQSAI